jgi:hypothetical protein
MRCGQAGMSVRSWSRGGYLDDDTQPLQSVGYAVTGQPKRLTR